MRKRINNQILTIRELRDNIKNIIQEPTEETQEIKPVIPVIRNFKTEKTSLKDLKVAAIMDRFTLECFRPECNLLELTPQNWKEEIDSFSPDLLFIESAWEGKDKLWYGLVRHCSDTLAELAGYCRELKIPIIFWSKEDPVHNNAFMPTAKLADFVFTTDMECVEKYKTTLEHDYVYHLHFGAQPKTHNPIEKYDRKDKYCFAGSYYHRYADRCRVFDAFADYFIGTRGFDIYDRNFHNDRPELKFPEQYAPYILGNLDPSEIDIAYKGYVYGVNMNSVTQSQSMFARRVFELIASNTIVIGNYSQGVKNYFGDLTFCTDDLKTLKSTIERYCYDTDSADKFRLTALRKVLSEHLMADRLDYIVEKVFGKSLKTKLPAVTVYSFVENQIEANKVISMFEKQTHIEKNLLLISDNSITAPDFVTVMQSSQFENTKACELIAEGGYLAYFDCRDWYGKNYILDMALTTRYGNFDAIGKAEYFTAQNSIADRISNNNAYRKVSQLEKRRSMANANLLDNLTGRDLTVEHSWNGEDFMSIDVMNYCENYSEEECPAVQDVVIYDQGIPASAIETALKKIKCSNNENDSLNVTVEDIMEVCPSEGGSVTFELQDDQVLLTSNLPNGKHQYFFLNDIYDIDLDLKLDGDRLWVFFYGEAKLTIHGYCLFYDENNVKIDVQSFRLGIRSQCVPPENAAYMKVAYRVSGPGYALLKGADFGLGSAILTKGGCFISRSNTLLLTNLYPAPDDLYKHMFVHKRVCEYKKDGKPMDVLCITDHTATREFEGINVIEGRRDLLDVALNSDSINTLCIHFMLPEMWETLKYYLNAYRIIIWAHGAEIQPWWRREFNFNNNEDLEHAKIMSERRMATWKSIFNAAKLNKNIHFVFVSNHFANEVFSDYEVSLPKEQYSIIHNCIDTNQFNYIPKKAEDRKKLLSIRPYASKTYANDLTVKTILELSKEPWFNELDIMIYGSGPLYKETLAPLKKFKNVHTEETFLTQEEIAKIHKDYGIFLTPTRMDTQGVSRDEAMSSGLVPVTNAVAAVPEFVDDSCAILTEGEDYKAMAEGIKKLYHDPELFLQMSENAANRVRSQTSREHTIEKELELIFPEFSDSGSEIN